MSEYNENFKVMIKSFFTKIFLDELFEKNNQLKSFKSKQIIYLFLLDNYFLDKYFNLFGYLINVDYTLIQIYSVLKIKALSIELNEKIIIFINKHISLENFGNLIFGIINNEKIFKSFFKSKNINMNYIYNLYNITKSVINNLIFHANEYKNINEKLLSFFDKINEHINNFLKINHNFAILELYLFGKIINETIINLNQNLIQMEKDAEENLKLKINISQIDLCIESFYSLIIPKFMKNIFIVLNNIENKNINYEYFLDNAFFSFFIALDIVSPIIDKKYYQILSSNIDSNILNFFKEFHCFNKSNKYFVDLNFFNLFHEKYLGLRNDSFKKNFLEYLYIFSLFKGKQEEKNLKSVIIEFFGDYKDNKTKEDFIKYGYISCYFLSSIKKDSSSGNKNKNVPIINPGDFLIINYIGERFKDDEKSFQKNNTNISAKI
jgi:hypothetical protein